MSVNSSETLEKEALKIENAMWDATAKNDQRGMDCNASGPCKDKDGNDLPTGGMIPIEPTAKDKAKLKDVVENFVLKRWAKRCGTQKCVDEWNATIGKIWAAIQAQQMYLPIHNQVLNWGMKDSINFAVQPEDQPHFQFLTFN